MCDEEVGTAVVLDGCVVRIVDDAVTASSFTFPSFSSLAFSCTFSCAKTCVVKFFT